MLNAASKIDLHYIKKGTEIFFHNEKEKRLERKIINKNLILPYDNLRDVWEIKKPKVILHCFYIGDGLELEISEETEFGVDIKKIDKITIMI